MFRKMTAVFIALLLAFSLSGCILIPTHKNIELRYDVSEIAAIEIFNLGDEVYDLYELEELMEQNFMPVATLTSEQYAEFAERLGEFEFSFTYVIVAASVHVYYSFAGYVAKITYANGEYELLNHQSQAYCRDGEHYMDAFNCDEGEWDRWIEDYLEKE